MSLTDQGEGLDKLREKIKQEISLQIQIAGLGDKVEVLSGRIEKLVREFQDYKDLKTSEEKRRLVAGVAFLGSIVLSLITYIWVKFVGH